MISFLHTENYRHYKVLLAVLCLIVDEKKVPRWLQRDLCLNQASTLR